MNNAGTATTSASVTYANSSASATANSMDNASISGQASGTVGIPGSLMALLAKPRFMVVEWGHASVGMVKQGRLAPAAFRRLFLESQGMRGERNHAWNNAKRAGVLVAWEETRIVTVPIRKWPLADGSSGWLCLASEDGMPPAFSVLPPRNPSC